jgi:hypothetical protein
MAKTALVVILKVVTFMLLIELCHQLQLLLTFNAVMNGVTRQGERTTSKQLYHSSSHLPSS